MKKLLSLALALVLVMSAVTFSLAKEKTYENALNAYEALFAYLNRAADFGVNVGRHDMFTYDESDYGILVVALPAIFFVTKEHMLFGGAFTLDKTDEHNLTWLSAFLYAFDSEPKLDSLNELVRGSIKNHAHSMAIEVLSATEANPFKFKEHPYEAFHKTSTSPIDGKEKEEIVVRYVGN